MIALVGSGLARSTTSNGFTSGAFDTSGANFLVVSLDQSGSSDETITDSKSNTWTKLTAQNGDNFQNRLYYAYNAVVGTGHTFTISGTATFPSFQILWFSGVKTTADPVGTENGTNQPFNNTITVASVTPTEDNGLVIASLGIGKGDETPTINGGFTVQENDNDGTSGHGHGAIAYLVQTTAAAAGPTWTIGNGAELDARIVWFKPAAAATRRFLLVRR